MRFDKLVIFTIVVVALLSASVPAVLVTTAPSHEEKIRESTPYSSINVYLYFSDGDENNILPNSGTPMKGAGSTLSAIIGNAFEHTEGYEVELLSTGAVGSVNGVEAPNGKSWVIFQWAPPEGWSPTTPGPMGDTTLVENTSYLVALVEYRESSGKTLYTVPEIDGPVSMAVFLLKCNTNEWGINPAQLGEGEEGEAIAEKLSHGGMYIAGYGSDVATAFADACRTAFGWEGPTHEAGALVLRVPESRTAGLTDDQRIGLEMGDGEGGTIPGWLGNFMGLKDVILYDSFIYWNQYCWSDEEYKWGYNGYCLGYYDPAVTKYFGLAYTESVMVEEGDDRYSPFRGIDPHDFVPE